MPEVIIIALLVIAALILLVRHYRRKGCNCDTCGSKDCAKRDSK
ncbi:MAG: FeoB-associated Cys-rich membrane protein [Lentisphaerae bacterium]|jgi:hypothetical protein|nr:FeoB-associated Cys-rich membrane protein [Victivallaceae bacterium]MDD5662886.1 FeoB-associated Cys-rich membrane protein [Victivallaceae bacterium]NLK83296.1 FeoB-associated Cys-rich membrane protein [Lentisphaerota bacterium]